MSRRGFLAGTLAAGAATAAWTKVFRVTPASAAEDGCALPEHFPPSIDLYREGYENWAGEIRVDDTWTAVPRTPEDVVLLANWAAEWGYRIRPRGSMHGWAPLTLRGDETCASRVVLVDTTEHLTAMQMVGPAPHTAVRVQTGAMLEDLLAFMNGAGCGWLGHPAVGDVTVGGVLAIDGHGTGIPALDETPLPGHAYGSVSNLVLAATAVVFDEEAGRYVLRTFARSSDEVAALATHVGRAFVTEVVLRVGPRYRLRCQSRVDVPVSELFAAPDSGKTQTLASFLDASGRIEIIWFAFTDKPWLKVWTLSPQKPLASREVNSPYNYVFTDNAPPELVEMGSRGVSENPSITPLYGQAQYAAVAAGLHATYTHDLWGWAKDLLIYFRTPSRMTNSGHVVLTRREDVQRVVHEFADFYQFLLAEYAAEGRYPINGTAYVRVSGLDRPEELGFAGAKAPFLSSLRPDPAHPEWNTAVWLNVLTNTGTPGAGEFCRELEAWMVQNYSGDYAGLRVEWSKGYAYTEAGGWRSREFVENFVPKAYGDDGTDTNPWSRALRTLNELDPYRVFGNDFIDMLLP